MNVISKTKRPFLLYVLALVFLLAGVISLIQTLGVFQAWNWWLAFTSFQPVIFQVFVGVFGALAWISADVILWLRKSWAVIYCSVVVILMTGWHWVARLALTQNPLPFGRHMLALAVTCIFLLFVFSSLYLVAPSMQPFHIIPKDGDSTPTQPTGDNNE